MLDINGIMEIIPQRAPFLMIDKVEDFVPGESAVAIKNVCINEPYFAGHFPGQPIMPGVLIVEALAQTGAIAILSMEENKGKNALFAGIDKLRFKRKVLPGDVLRLEVKVIKTKGPIGVGEAVATVDGKIAAKGELTFAIVDGPEKK
jgi:3-hydroxyacyl-[acyl-carrier-protein] dehydratase